MAIHQHIIAVLREVSGLLENQTVKDRTVKRLLHKIRYEREQ